MRRKTQQRVALGLLASVVVAVIVACYGATEVKLEITRDVKCPPRGEARTAIFVGRPGHGAIDPIAETEDCIDLTDGTFASSIGSLVVVPSDDRDARVTVEVAISLKPRGSGANVPPKSPKDCLLDATDCIVARRTFAFISHQSRVLPIKLFEECRDRTCLPGTTCVADDCRPDDIEVDGFCDDRQTCNLPPRDGGTDAPIADAPIGDAPVPEPVDAGVCTGRGDGVLLEGIQQPVGRIVSTATNLFWETNAGSVMTARKDGTDKKVVYPATVAKVSSFAVDDKGVTWVGENGRIYKAGQLSDGGALFWAGPFSNPIQTLAATESVVYWAMGSATYYTASSAPSPVKTAYLNGSTIPADRLSARTQGTETIVYALKENNLRSFDGSAGEIANFEAGVDVLAVEGGALIATATEILSFTDGKLNTMRRSAAVTADTLARNKSVVFWTESSPVPRIMRLDLAPLAGPIATALPIGAHAMIRGLAVDDACVYFWAPDAIRVAPNK
jgi:hypothetical protein